MGFTTFNIISFLTWLTEYQQGATAASKIFHEYKYIKFQYEYISPITAQQLDISFDYIALMKLMK